MKDRWGTDAKLVRTWKKAASSQRDVCSRAKSACTEGGSGPSFYIGPGVCSRPVCAVLSRFSHVCLFATLWTIALQACLFMGFSRQEYWNQLLCPTPGDLPELGIKPKSDQGQVLKGTGFHEFASLCTHNQSREGMMIISRETHCAGTDPGDLASHPRYTQVSEVLQASLVTQG